MAIFAFYERLATEIRPGLEQADGMLVTPKMSTLFPSENG
jgi:hypothetical protein